MEKKRFEFLELGKVNEPYAAGIEEAVLRVVRSGRFVGGPEVTALEERLCALTGASYAIGVSNGLDALRLILRAYIELGDMKPGDEVIVPANTYIASVLAISDAGLKPVLVDAAESTSNLDTALIESAITDRTRAIMTVHLYGRVSWDDEIKRLAAKYGLKVVEDNAQAIGAVSDTPGLYGHKVTGALGDAAGISFYPTKNIGALGDAGAVLTHDARLAAAVRALANYGGDRRYHNIYKGFNCRLDPVQAAVVEYKLRYVDEENRLRRKLASVYCSEIKNRSVRLPEITSGHVFHQFVVHVDDRDAFTRYLDANGTGWDIHYATPPHMQPCYADSLGREFAGRLQVTEKLARQCVSLPISRCTSIDDAHEIAATINRF